MVSKNPKAVAHMVYHNCAGIFKSPDGKNATSKNDNPKKFAFPELFVYGLLAPCHLPITSVVWGENIVEPLAVDGVMIEANTVISD